MTMHRSIRKFALTAHVTSSVGWLGAVAAFLAIAVAGLTSRDSELVRASYLTLELIGWSVIVPLCLTSMPTGLVMSLGTEWGLFRHYWVVTKFLISVVATILLLVHMEPVGHLAAVVREATLTHGQLAGLRIQLAADAAAALVALLVATALSVYKPRGVTPFVRVREGAAIDGPAAKIFITTVVVTLLLFIVLHLTVFGPRGH